MLIRLHLIELHYRHSWKESLLQRSR